MRSCVKRVDCNAHVNNIFLQHGKLEFTGQNAAPTLQVGPVFSPVHTQSSVTSPISIPTHYQQNNKARNSAFRYSGRPFTSHHLQPILPRPASQNTFVQPQEVTSKPVEKAFEPKVCTTVIIKCQKQCRSQCCDHSSHQCDQIYQLVTNFSCFLLIYLCWQLNLKT